MTPIEPVEIALDKPRKVRFVWESLTIAETEINKRRASKPEDWISIDVLVLDSIRNTLRIRGILPRDLLVVLIWAGLVYEPKEQRLSVDQVMQLLDQSSTSIGDLSYQIWDAWYIANRKNILMVESIPQEKEKKSDTILTDGSTNGVSPESN